MSPEEVLRDLIDRLNGAADSLYWLASDSSGPMQLRREGKREGVILAKGYAEEALRQIGSLT